MIWEIKLATLIVMIACAVAAINVRDLLGAAILFGIYSFMMCIQWLAMGAVDVAFTEAAIGAGISTVLVLAAIFRTTRRTKD
ncbi:hydrogenase subunit MbhD domain-containing protein [Desulfohalovibrio reitneri]|uniref:hydrogenase subunit MbhD domain-containing protein n=1 Tax=Desulfohalovibrio reitneri TaxID=1307759 RepID=UPI0004A74CA0|nr:hydrogenase subunit MbhD domain-containing protein [Desulfohalovibrio reitneri]